MQLHNHPSMLVVTYILKGFLLTESYTHEADDQRLSIFSRQDHELRNGNIVYIDGLRTN